MQTKLTLRLEDTAIENAKAWARAHGVSLSSAVEQFFSHLQDKPGGRPLSTWTLRLVGAGGGEGDGVGKDRLREAYLDHLEEKYR